MASSNRTLGLFLPKWELDISPNHLRDFFAVDVPHNELEEFKKLPSKWATVLIEPTEAGKTRFHIHEWVR